MPKLLIIMAVPFVLIWAVRSWWRIRRAPSERERSFLARTSLGAALGVALAIIAVVLLPLKGQLAFVPLAIAGVVVVNASVKKARERIRAQEADPAERAKRVN